MDSKITIKFPVLQISGNFVLLTRSMEEITHCTNMTLKQGFYEGLTLVDTEGQRVRIAAAHKIRTLPPKLNMSELIGFISGNPRVQVELALKPASPSPISLEETKAIIFDSFRKESRFWRSMNDFEDFRARVKAASSLLELFAVFSDYHVY